MSEPGHFMGKLPANGETPAKVYKPKAAELKAPIIHDRSPWISTLSWQYCLVKTRCKWEIICNIWDNAYKHAWECAPRCSALRVEAENIGGVLHDKKKRAVIFIALARIAPANRSSKFKELYIRIEEHSRMRARSGEWYSHFVSDFTAESNDGILKYI